MMIQDNNRTSHGGDPFRNGTKEKGTGHGLENLLAVVLVAVMILVAISKWNAGSGNQKGLFHRHNWAAADCIHPEICLDCGKTRGEAQGHDWLFATYTDPATCSVCGETVGEPLATEAPAVGYPLIQCPVIKDSNDGSSQKDILAGTWVDTFGFEYPDSLRFWVADFANWMETEFIRYKLEEPYSRLELTFVSEENSEHNTRGRVLVYGGQELLYESEWVTDSTPAIQATVDISGYSEIMILCETDSPAFYYGIVQAMLYP